MYLQCNKLVRHKRGKQTYNPQSSFHAIFWELWALQCSRYMMLDTVKSPHDILPMWLPWQSYMYMYFKYKVNEHDTPYVIWLWGNLFVTCINLFWNIILRIWKVTAVQRYMYHVYTCNMIHKCSVGKDAGMGHMPVVSPRLVSMTIVFVTIWLLK